MSHAEEDLAVLESELEKAMADRDAVAARQDAIHGVLVAIGDLLEAVQSDKLTAEDRAAASFRTEPAFSNFATLHAAAKEEFDRLDAVCAEAQSALDAACDETKP